MGTEQLNDNLGQEASDAIDRNKELEAAVRAMLGGSVGGYYGQEPKKKKPKRKDNGKRGTNPG